MDIARSVAMSNDGKQFGLIECCVCSEPAIWVDENEDYFCDACKDDRS